MLQARIAGYPKDHSKRFDALVKDLDAALFAVRDRATNELLTFAEPFEQRLLEIRDKSNVEIKSRIDQILERMWRPTLERVAASRALGVLEMIGSPECEQVLDQIARSHGDPGIAAEAAESRDRLGRSRTR